MEGPSDEVVDGGSRANATPALGALQLGDVAVIRLGLYEAVRALDRARVEMPAVDPNDCFLEEALDDIGRSLDTFVSLSCLSLS